MCCEAFGQIPQSFTTVAPFFYMRALDHFPTDPKKCCMTKQRMGTNILKNMLPELSEKSGIGVHYTNHSLRATAITRMFNKGIPEKVIAETSGHKTMKALRCYEHTSQQQQQAVTAVINGSNIHSSNCTMQQQQPLPKEPHAHAVSEKKAAPI